MAELTKDVMLVAKSTRAGKDKKGRDQLDISLSQEEAIKLLEELTKLASNERGVKLAIHYGEKQSEAGRSFLSAFFFVKAIQEYTGFQGGGAKSFKPKDTLSAKERIEKVKADMAKA